MLIEDADHLEVGNLTKGYFNYNIIWQISFQSC